MALTKHHDLINTDYFNSIKYVREFEIALQRKLTKQEKKTMEDTFRTLIKINNMWSNYSNKTDDSFYKNKIELETYLKKYERNISKFVDEFCIELYNLFETWLDEMNDIETRNLDKRCNGIKLKITEILRELDKRSFDYVYNGYFYYKRNASNKAKRAYMTLLVEDKELDRFIEEFFVKYGSFSPYYQFDTINYIRELYKLFSNLSYCLIKERYNQALEYIINFLINGKNTNQELFNSELYRIGEICNLIINKKYDDAYNEVMIFIKQNEKWYVRWY